MKILSLRFDPRIKLQFVRHKKLIAAGLACSFAASSFAAANSLIVKHLTSALQKQDKSQLILIAIFAVSIYIVKYFFTRGQIYLLSKAAARLTTDLRYRLFKKLQQLPVSYFNEKRAGSIQSVLTNDVNVYQGSISIIRDSVDGPTKIITCGAVIFVLNWQLALAAMTVLPFMAIFIQRNARRMKKAQGQVQHDLGHLTAMMQESLQGTRVIKAFGAEERVTKQFDNLLNQSFTSQMKAVRILSKLKPMVELIGAISLGIVIVLCGYVYLSPEFLSNLLGFVFALDGINQGARNLGSLNQTYAQVQAATDRIYSEILDVDERLCELPDHKTIDNPKGHIEFRNVTFEYPDGTKALNKVSFSIKPGTSLAIVGPSGAGKSTIADLMLRYYDPTYGEILFDGVDIRTLKTSWLRSQIGVVPQQTFLFAGSIADNIKLGSPDASDDEVFAAAKRANAEPFISSMPNGFETELGERGIKLSGGEAQRIAIARALIREPRLLLLDEATSNLDAISEKQVQMALDEIMKHRTTMFIAHRLTTAARADQILVLRKGEVLEYGSHAELMRRNEAYAGMYRAFTSGVLDDAIG